MKKINVAITLFTGFTILTAYAPNPESFFEAIESGNIVQVQHELFAGADVNTPDEHSITPLRWAVFHCHEPIAHLLIERGANVNTAGADGYTPLHTASEKGNTEIVKLLLKNKADVNAASWRYKQRPLHCAIEEDEYEAPLKTEKDITEIVKLLLNSPGIDINAPDAFGWTPLNAATTRKKQDVIKLLLASPGIEIASPNKFGETPLHKAANNGDAEIVKLLLQAGADTFAPNQNDYIPIPPAGFGFGTAIKFLEAGANIFVRKQGSYIPLDLIRTSNYGEVIDSITQADGDIFARFVQNEKTPFELAENDQIKNIFRNYIKNNIHKHIENKMMKRGFTAFSMARYPHLGAESPANILPTEIFYYIYKNFLKR